MINIKQGNLVLFRVRGVALIGSLATGEIAGLDPWEEQLCENYLANQMSLEDLMLKNESLGLALVSLQMGTTESSCSAYLHVTQRCNLDCEGCYSKGPGRNILPDPALDEIQRALHFLTESGVKTINISGGEPFLRNDLPEILYIARMVYGIEKVNVLTNGTVIEDNVLCRCAPFMSALSVSFDGLSDTDRSAIRHRKLYSSLVRVVKKAKELGIVVAITPTIHRGNWKDIERYYELAEALGTGLNLSLLSSPSSGCLSESLLPSKQEMSDLAHELIRCAIKFYKGNVDSAFLSSALECRKGCGAGKTIYSIDADGEIYPCHMMHDKRFSMGNAFSSEKAFHQSIRPTIELSNNCSLCEYGYLCGGGCLARAISSEKGVDPYCEMQKCFYCKTMELLKLALEKEKKDVVFKF